MKRNVWLANALAIAVGLGTAVSLAGAQGYSQAPYDQRGYGQPGGPPPDYDHRGPARRDSTLHVGESLMRGQMMVSNNGWYKLEFQQDGNVVLSRTRDNRPLWDTRTNGSPAFRLTMQDDGNVVLYSRGNRPLWSSGITGPQMRHGQVLILQDDGNLVVYSRGKVYWASNTVQRDGGPPHGYYPR